MSRKLWLGALALLLLLAACRGAGMPTGEEELAPHVGRGGEGDALVDESAGEAGPRSIRGDLPPLGPNVIKTADLRMEIRRNTLRETVGEVTAVAGRHGGFIISTEVSGEKARSGILVIRVPAERFEQALAELRDLGTKVTRENISGQDVSQEFVDLEARLRNWRAQEVVLLQLMDRARTVAETIRVQRELQQVQLEIERIRGRLRYLEDQTTMSTITVGLREAGAATVRPGTLERAWQRAVQSFLAIASGVIVAAGAVLPFLLLALAGWIVFRLVRPRLGTLRTP